MDGGLVIPSPVMAPAAGPTPTSPLGGLPPSPPSGPVLATVKAEPLSPACRAAIATATAPPPPLPRTTEATWRLVPGETDDNQWRPPRVFDMMACCWLPNTSTLGGGSDTTTAREQWSPLGPPPVLGVEEAEVIHIDDDSHHGAPEDLPPCIVCYGGLLRAKDAVAMGLPEGTTMVGSVWCFTTVVVGKGDAAHRRFVFEKMQDQAPRAYHTTVGVGYDVWSFGGVRSDGFTREGTRAARGQKANARARAEEQLSTDAEILCFRPSTGAAATLRPLGAGLPPLLGASSAYSASTQSVYIMGGQMMAPTGRNAGTPAYMGRKRKDIPADTTSYLYSYHIQTNFVRKVQISDGPIPSPNWLSHIAQDGFGLLAHESAVVRRQIITGKQAQNNPDAGTTSHGLYWVAFGADTTPDIAPPAVESVRIRGPEGSKYTRNRVAQKEHMTPHQAVLNVVWRKVKAFDAPGLDAAYAPPSQAVKSDRQNVLEAAPLTHSLCSFGMRDGGWVMNAESVWRYRPSTFAAQPPPSVRYKRGHLRKPPLAPVAYFTEVDPHAAAAVDSEGRAVTPPVSRRVICLCSGHCPELLGGGTRKRSHFKMNLHVHEVELPTLLDDLAPVHNAATTAQRDETDAVEASLLMMMKVKAEGAVPDASPAPPPPGTRMRARKKPSAKGTGMPRGLLGQEDEDGGEDGVHRTRGAHADVDAGAGDAPMPDGDTHANGNAAGGTDEDAYKLLLQEIMGPVNAAAAAGGTPKKRGGAGKRKGGTEGTPDQPAKRRRTAAGEPSTTTSAAAVRPAVKEDIVLESESPATELQGTPAAPPADAASPTKGAGDDHDGAATPPAAMDLAAFLLADTSDDEDGGDGDGDGDAMGGQVADGIATATDMGTAHMLTSPDLQPGATPASAPAAAAPAAASGGLGDGYMPTSPELGPGAQEVGVDDEKSAGGKQSGGMDFLLGGSGDEDNDDGSGAADDGGDEFDFA